MKKKSLMIVAVVLTLSVLAAGSAMARWDGANDQRGYNCWRTDDGAADVDLEKVVEFKKETLPLRDQLLTKKLELRQEYNKEKPDAEVIGKLKDLGNTFAYESGFTVGLKDLEVSEKGRNKIFADAEKKAKTVGTVRAFTEATQKLDKWLEKELGKKQNSFFTMLQSGAKGNSGQIRQIVAAPVLVKDINDRPVPYPIKGSYSEGLTASDYLSAIAGARKGMVDRALMTAQPGAFAKEYVASAINERITMPDCGTHKGSMMSVNDLDAVGRYLAKGVPGVARYNDLVTPATLAKIRGRVKMVTVRGPATCMAPDGVCQKCYGLDENGQDVEMGRNVGVVSAQAITEPLTQMQMRTFHTGSVLQPGGRDSSQGLRGGFERVAEILEMHHHVRGKATIAEVGGTVSGLKKSSAGGWNLSVGGREHFIDPGRMPVVKNGDKVKNGDRLSDGNIKPQELLQYKGPEAVKDYLVHALDSEYQSQGIKVNKKIFETAVRPLINNAQVMEPGKSKYIPGDFATISAIERFNEGKDKDDQVKYEPLVKGVNTFPHQSKDWLHRLNYTRLKESLTQGAAEGWKSDIMKSPVGSYAYGIFFGKDGEKTASAELPSYYDILNEEETDELEEVC